MITELLPLLVLVTVITIARNVYEFYAVERAERRQAARPSARHD